MASNASRGAAAKGKTKRWLEQRGYQVGYLELVRWVWKNQRPAFAVKSDQFGSDLLAVKSDAVVFVQVKSGESARTGTFPEARRKFDAFRFPESVRAVIIGWPVRAREPRIIECYTDGTWREGVEV